MIPCNVLEVAKLETENRPVVARASGGQGWGGEVALVIKRQQAGSSGWGRGMLTVVGIYCAIHT